jgi:predicted transcriptional regulator of viral defense system
METRSLSPVEARVVLALESEGIDEIALDALQRRAGVSRSFARKIAHTLIRKGWLQRVGRGRYLLNPSRHGPSAVPDTDPLRFGTRIVHPYYFGYATAAELLGLLPQASRVYYLVSPIRGGGRMLHAAQFRRVHLPSRQFFGTEVLERRGERVVVSNVERTILDGLRRPEFIGGLGGVARILESAGRRIDWGRMEGYLTRFGQRALTLRLGFLAERLLPANPPPTGWIRRALARPEESYVPLGSPREFGRRGIHDRRWHVIRNVPDSLLFAEVDVR